MPTVRVPLERWLRIDWRFVLAAYLLPVPIAWFGSVLAAVGVSRLRFGEAELPEETTVIFTAGVCATIAAVGFARTTKGLRIERARYQSLPMTVAFAVTGAAVAVAALGVDAARTVAVSISAAGAGGLLGAVVGRAAARVVCRPDRLPISSVPAAAHLTRHRLADGATAVWSARVPPLHPCALVRFVAAYLAWWALWSSGWSVVGRFAVAGVVAAAAVLWTVDWRARVTVGPGGVAVRSGLGGRTWQKVPLDAIVGAKVVRARRALWWRSPQWSVPGQVGLVPRNGDALLLRLSDGTQFAVRLDDAATAAGVVNTLVDRRSQSAC